MVRRLPAGRGARERVLARERALRHARRSSSSRSPTRCDDEYKAIVDAGLMLQVDDAVLDARGRLDPVAGRLAGGLPQVGGAARRRAQPRAARACRRTASATTSAGAAGTARTPSTRRSGRRRPGPQGQRRPLRDGAGQRAPRARVAGLGGRQAARGQEADPGRRHPPHERRRAPRAGRGAAHAAGQARRARERPRRHRLRLRPGRVRAARAPGDPVGEARGARRGREACERAPATAKV